MEMETLADVVFLVEGSAANGAYINELKTNYIVPTLEHFSQGPIEDREYLISERYSTQYCVVLYRTTANLLEPMCTTFGPYASPQKVMDLFERLPLVGGGMESCANLAEGLATAHVCFDDMKDHRARYNKDGNLSTQKHCILMCNSPPYSMPVMECWKYTGKTVEQLAGLFHERKINLSIIAPRKIPILFKIFMKADGDQPLTAKKYAKNIRHLVLLKGYHLKERPQSPNSAAAMANQNNQVVGGPNQQQQQQQQKNVQQQQQQQQQNSGLPMDNTHASPQQQQQLQQQQVSQMGGMNSNQQPNPINQQLIQQQQQFGGQNPMQNQNFQGQANRWLFNPNQQQLQARPQFIPNAPGGPMVPMGGPVNQGGMPVQNSALISQLSAPPNQNVNPMIQQQQIRMQMMNQQQQMQQLQQQQQQQQQQNVMNPNMSGPGGPNPQQQQVPVANNQPNTSMANQQNPGPSSDQTLMRDKIWSGTLEWVEKSKPDQQKIPRTLQCTVTANIKDGEPEIKAINWPPKLLMQLMPKHLVGNIGGQFLKDSKMVVFKPQPCEALDALAKNMTTIFAGCVHFTTPPNMPACDIKVLILLYTAEKNAFLGFIPNNQSMFVERLRKVIQQKQSMGMQQTAGGGPNNMQQQQQQQQQQGQQQLQNPMANQIGNNMNPQQQQQQQQQQDQSQQQQHFNQYNTQQQMNMQMAGGPMNQQMMGGPPMSGGPDQMVGNNPMQQQQMTMMQHQRMPMMTGGNPNNPQQQQMPPQQMQQRMVRPMMNNNPGLRHLLQQQSTPGQQFRPQMGGVGGGPGGVPMGGGGMPNPNQMTGGPGGPGGGPNRPFDDNFEYM